MPLSNHDVPNDGYLIMTEHEETGSVEAGMPEESGTASTESISFVQQIILVFSDPANAFEKLVTSPRWIGAFLLVVIVSIAGTQISYPLVMDMQREMAERSIENRQLTPEQEQMAMQRFSQSDTPVNRIITIVFQLLGQLFWLVIMAGILMFGGNVLLGGESTFKTLLAITAHGWLVMIPKTLLTVPLMLAKGSAAVATSLQILIPQDQWMTPLGAALGAVDLFAIWMIFLLATGISIAYRFSRAKAATLVISLYVMMALVGVGLMAVFGRMFG